MKAVPSFSYQKDFRTIRKVVNREDWKIGRLEDWKIGRMEGWKPSTTLINKAEPF
jgi:hypothetical protein